MIKQQLRRFNLIRDEDISGCSGTGTVAEGIEFSNGKCAIVWLTAVSSMAIYDNIKEVEAIHGHDGKTHIQWIDLPETTQPTIKKTTLPIPNLDVFSQFTNKMFKHLPDDF